MDFISASAGGLTFHLGLDMKTSHKGMGIDQDDYTALKKHLVAIQAGTEALEVEEPNHAKSGVDLGWRS